VGVTPTLIPRLEPYTDLNPVIARGIGMRGPVRYFLGLLRATSGDFEGAIADFEAAHATLSGWGAQPRAALARLYLAEAIEASGDTVRAAAERDAALADMERVGVRPPKAVRRGWA
jgi:hypothetical protein